MNLKNGKVFTSKFVGTGPSSYEKSIYRAAVSQRLKNTGIVDVFNYEFPTWVDAEDGRDERRCKIFLSWCCSVRLSHVTFVRLLLLSAVLAVTVV